MPDTITKANWLSANECLSGAWFGLREAAVPPDEAGLFRMEQGQEIGALARRFYPEGVLVSREGSKSAAAVTRDLVSNTAVETLFEAAFSSPPFVAKADVLRRESGTWHVIEVKSSFINTSKLNELVDDLAYTVWVLGKAGLPVSKASLALLSRGYRFGDSPERLFEFADKTGDAMARAAEYEAAAPQIVDSLFRDTPPTPKLISACRTCGCFGDRCLRTGAEHTVLEIPQLHHTKLKKLSDAGIIDLAQVPTDLKLNERQERAKYSALSGNTVVESGLASALQTFEWPCHYLDFETVATVLPLYGGQACHQQVLTQFSIHHRDSIEAEPRHSEYLADATRDCERELAEALIAAVGTRGSIVVYSSFEAVRIKGLRDRFPDLKESLDAILSRLKDLLPVIQDNVYHPDFQGSFSIKQVLPALVPQLSYDALDVRNGDTAIARFARMARGEIVGGTVDETRRQLLDYCKMDTFAMVSLHEVLDGLASVRRGAA